MRDSLYENVPFALSELKHFYGPNVHLVGNPYLLSLLATLCAKDTQQPAVNTLVRTLYNDLITMVVNHEFPRRQVTIPSRMIQYTPRGIYPGEILDPEVRAISVNIARAGTLPSQVTYDLLNTILNPRLVRQDHHIMSREALLAAKHVLVEKPMVMNAAEVADLFGLAAAQGVFLMEAMWMKFTPGFRRLREEIARGRIGEVRSVRATFGASFPEGGSRWDLAASGGALLDQGIYPITLAHALLGSPESITARGTTRADGLDLSEHFTFEYPDGRFAQGASSMVEFLDLAASVNGTLGWIDIPPYFWGVRRLEIHTGATQESFERPEVVEFDEPGNGYVPMLREVIRAINTGMLEHPEHDANATVEVFTLLDEIMSQVRQQVPASK